MVSEKCTQQGGQNLVCVIAFVCDPSKSSEPGNAAQWVAAYLRAGYAVTAISRDDKPRDSRFASVDWIQVAPDQPRRVGKLEMYRRYVSWQKRINGLIPTRASITHHVSWGSWAVGTFIRPRNGVLVYGPIGGGQVPRISSRWLRLGPRSFFLEVVRSGVVGLRTCLSFGAFKRPDRLLICGNARAASRLRRRMIPVHTEVAAGLNGPVRHSCQVPPKRILWIGRFFDIKDPLLAIKVAYRFLSSHPDFTLTMLGDGPRMPDCQNLVAKLGLAEQVHFAGWVSQAVAEEFLRDSWCLLITSFRDSFSAQIVDALRMRCPVVSCELPGGPDLTLGAVTLVSESPVRSLAERLADALIGIATPESRELVAQSAEFDVEHFDWDAKLDRLRTALRDRGASFSQ